jgi:hypothetical protein
MIPGILKEKVFMVIEEQMPIKVFEAWLYDQQDLSEMMSNDLILGLFSFNCNQRGAQFEFKNTFLKYFDEQEFVLWKVKANLRDLIAGKETRDRILREFYYQDYDKYSFLQSIGSYMFYFEDDGYFDIQVALKELKQDSAQLLKQIEEQEKHPGFKISEFRSDPIEMKGAMYPPATNSPVIYLSEKKWWKFWQ